MGVERFVKLCLVAVTLLAMQARADLSIPSVGEPRAARERAVPQEDDDEQPERVVGSCGPLLERAATALRSAGAAEIDAVDGRSLIANVFLARRTVRTPSIDVEVRVDCTRRTRDDAAWSSSDSYFERQRGHLQASFFVAPRLAGFVPTLEAFLDRALATR